MQTKHITATIKAATTADFDGTFILSTEAHDRHGDVVHSDGWDLTKFNTNPIALWQHDHSNPIGKWMNARVEGKQLLADLKLAGTNLGKMAKQLIQDGVLKAVSVGFIPLVYDRIDKDDPMSGYDIKAAELIEASLVSIGANPEALLLAKQFGLSDEERAAIFTDHAPAVPSSKSADTAVLQRARDLIGKHASKPNGTPTTEPKKMKLSERIEMKQGELAAFREELEKAVAEYAADPSQENELLVSGLTEKAQETETQLETLTKAEAAISKAVQLPAGTVSAPAKAPAFVRQANKNYEEGELFFAQAAVTALAHIQRCHIGEVLKKRYANDKGLEAIMTKADSVIGTTTGTNWAAPLLEESVEGFIDLFTNNSVYGALRGGGTSLNFSGKGSIKIPSRGATKKPAGAFVGEGAPIPVKEAYFTSQSLTPDKMAVIVPFAEELVTATNGQIQTIIRDAIIQDTAEALDAILLDANAATAVRPAGLLNGVTLTASAGDTAANIATDVKTLMANFVSSDSPKAVRLIMNGARELGVRTVTTSTGDRAFPEITQGNLLGLPVIVSGNCTAAEVYSLNASDFWTAYDAPIFDISNTAVLHMEDTTPLEVVSGAATPVTADPVRSLFQTDSVAIRMKLPVTWAMVRAGMVDGINTVSW